jgi:glycosyltransferase involved in cell wall biosynthesis
MNRLRAWLLHNRYQTRGGEDQVFEAEAALLRQRGIEVTAIAADNDAISEYGPLRKLLLAWRAAYSRPLAARAWKPFQGKPLADVVHVHNFFPLLTPAVHTVARELGAATVQHLHNYRLGCAAAVLMRGGRVCEDCLPRSTLPALVHRCYRGSLIGTLAVTRMIATNRNRGTWQRDVDVFVALTEFGRRKFIAMGVPADRIVVKPNFLADPALPAGAPSASRSIVFAGRLSPEKGVHVLLRAWARARKPAGAALQILGQGPEESALKALAGELGVESSVQFLGLRPRAESLAATAQARALALPSVWYEGFPLVLIEAMALGRPVVASDLGALSELVLPEQTGLLFRAGDAEALGACLERTLVTDRAADRWGAAARERYALLYTPERNFDLLMGIYRLAIERRGGVIPEELKPFAPAQPGPA